ncbi:hypothetical protein G4177_06245 [Corallococcus sp. ZKHCc1 1396]|uniref:Uncharacterized protein n=1 Tax=Corallococcus soli TaxID=2710757 RepID=A0ABR9PIL6_9BACT|nr:hypothetical protein [Corallococcus soli]MBE4747778.1 hypothetical protein [Corallococcus soli]
MDEIDRMHAEDDRRAKLRAAVKARLAEIEAELPGVIREVSTLQNINRVWGDHGLTGSSLTELDSRIKRRDTLIAEHSVLEGLLERHPTRLRANAALFFAAVSFVVAAINFIKQQ